MDLLLKKQVKVDFAVARVSLSYKL